MLGKFIKRRCNAHLAKCLFTSSLEQSKALLEWTNGIEDEFAMEILDHGDDLHAIKEFIDSGAMAKHERINSIERIKAIIRDPNGSSLHDAIMLGKRALETKHSKMVSIPSTLEEQRIKQLDDAFLLTFGATPAEEVAVCLQPSPTVYAKCQWNPLRKSAWHRTIWYRINGAARLADQLTKQHGRDRYLEYMMVLWERAHLPLVQYLDDDSIAFDEAHFLSLYKPLGDCTFDPDCFTITRTTHTINETPVQLLQRHYPNHAWTVEEVLRRGVPKHNPKEANYSNEANNPNYPTETHTIYYACQFLMNQCRTLGNIAVDGPIRDALWNYCVSFTDLFYHCTQWDDEFLLTPIGSTKKRGGGVNETDELTPWEKWGTHLDVRTFHAGDLPDLFHVLQPIPLWGEMHTPSHWLGKIYQKSLPFACQRRHIIELLNVCSETEAFWQLLSKLVWVMLAGLYPGQPAWLPMQDLVRAKELTENRELLMSCIRMKDQDGVTVTDGGPLLVYIIFRQHIVYMSQRNPTYIDYARKVLPCWDQFVDNTAHLAALVRQSNLLPADPFARARAALSAAAKKATPPYRLRRFSATFIIASFMNKFMQNVIIRGNNTHLAAAALNCHNDVYYKEALAFFSNALDVKCKAAILNIVLRIPPSDRLTMKGFSLLRLEEFGSISIATINQMYYMTHIYYQQMAKPANFMRCMQAMDGRDFVIACYYFNQVALAVNIQVITLDATTTQRQQQAMMTHRCLAYPGQHIPASVFNVGIALCCARVWDLMGDCKYGSKAVTYNIESSMYVCGKRKILHARNKLGADMDHEGIALANLDEDDDELDDEFDQDLDEDNEAFDEAAAVLDAQQDDAMDIEFDTRIRRKKKPKTEKDIAMEARKAIRIECRRFNRPPCGQPIQMINLLGKALIWGNRLDKRIQIMFCPKCAAKHIYTAVNFSGALDGLYRCNECAMKEVTNVPHMHCAYCIDSPAQSQMSEQYKLLVTTTEYPNVQQEWLYFCRGHYNIAKRYAHNMVRADLWDAIRKVSEKELIERSVKFNNNKL